MSWLYDVQACDSLFIQALSLCNTVACKTYCIFNPVPIGHRAVPCLSTEATMLDESLDIMTWALAQNDPARWLQMRIAGHALISDNDGPFKQALDRVKYASQLNDANPAQDRADASVFLLRLEGQLTAPFLFGAQPALADMAILPFVRQFAFVDKNWFINSPWPRLKKWLETFLVSSTFLSVMGKIPPWAPGDPDTIFPA